MEYKEGWKKECQEMKDSDLLIIYHWLFTLVDGLLAENKLLAKGGVFAKNDNEANFLVDDFANNKAKINNYRIFLDFISQIMNERVNNYLDSNPISGYQIPSQENSFYEDSNIQSLFCSFQIYSEVVTDIQKIEELAIEIQNSISAPKNETPLGMVTRFHTTFVTRMRVIINLIIKKMAK